MNFKNFFEKNSIPRVFFDQVLRNLKENTLKKKQNYKNNPKKR